MRFKTDYSCNFAKLIEYVVNMKSNTRCKEELYWAQLETTVSFLGMTMWTLPWRVQNMNGSNRYLYMKAKRVKFVKDLQQALCKYSM